MSNAATAESGHFHAVRFYKDAASLSEIVCNFVAEGLAHGEPAVVIATSDHVQEFRRCLASKGVDLESPAMQASVTVLDAQRTLDTFMKGGVPMATAFRDAVGSVLSATAARHPGKTIRAYGEMVDVLWQNGQTAAALRLETLWNELARSHRFGLLCGYAIGGFYKGATTDEICGVHSHVVSDSGAHIRLN